MIFIANKFIPSVFMIMLAGCAGAAQQMSAPSQLGVGRDRFSTLTLDMISDMRLFFSKQIIFNDSGDCPVRIMLDSQKISNESAERFDFNLIIDGFRSHLNNPENQKKLSLAGRKIAFVNTERRPVAGAMPARKCLSKKLGADYLLAGRIISDEKIDEKDVRQRQTLITFWLLDLETSAKAWSSPPYIFKSYGQNDVIYY